MNRMNATFSEFPRRKESVLKIQGRFKNNFRAYLILQRWWHEKWQNLIEKWTSTKFSGFVCYLSQSSLQKSKNIQIPFLMKFIWYQVRKGIFCHLICYFNCPKSPISRTRYFKTTSAPDFVALQTRRENYPQLFNIVGVSRMRGSNVSHSFVDVRNFKYEKSS